MEETAAWEISGFHSGEYEDDKKEVKQSRYTPWRRLGGKEV
jgi:hypothetical protein